MNTQNRTAPKARTPGKTRHRQLAPAERALELLRKYDRAVEELARVERTPDPDPRPGKVWDLRIDRAVDRMNAARQAVVEFVRSRTNVPPLPTGDAYRDDSELLAGAVRVKDTILVVATGFEGEPRGGFLIRLDVNTIPTA